jgi:Putative addiction module component
MTQQVSLPLLERVLHDALALSEAERAELATALLASLDAADVSAEQAVHAQAYDVEQAWVPVIERRAREALAGEPPGPEAHQAIAELRARLRQAR